MGLLGKWFGQKTEQPQALANRLIDEGNLLEAEGDLDAALLRYMQALEIAPDMARPHMNVGNVRLARGDATGALAAYDAALRADSMHYGAHFNRGNALAALGQTESAMAEWVRTLELRPDFADAYVAKAVLLENMGRLHEAAQDYRAALKLQPDYGQVLSRLGSALQDLRQMEEAIDCHKKAVALEPLSALTHLNLGNALKDAGDLLSAESAYRRACELDPNEPAFRTQLLFCMAYRQEKSQLELREEAELFGKVARQTRNCYQHWLSSPDPNRQIRVGFVSGDFRQHPVGYFLETVLSSLASMPDRSIDLVAYSTQPKIMSDSYTDRLRQHFNEWNELEGINDTAFATMIHDRDRIDILIDLSGHTSYTRVPVFAAKPSPVQVSWLGYFATTGLKEMDWFLADPVTMPAQFESHFSEKIWRLPQSRLCFSPPQPSPDVANLPALDNGYVTFGCFNHLSKISDEVVAVWSRVLRAVSGSRLLLKSHLLESEQVRQSVLTRFATHEIGEQQILMEGSSSRYDYLGTYARIDIALDPFPYPGGTTSVESLWMGVPVLTLAGESFLSRQGAGLMVNADLSDWVASTQEDYLRIAIEKSSDLQSLAELRKGLRAQVKASPLMDALLFATHFQDALRQMWRQWCDRH